MKNVCEIQPDIRHCVNKLHRRILYIFVNSQPKLPGSWVIWLNKITTPQNLVSLGRKVEKFRHVNTPNSKVNTNDKTRNSRENKRKTPAASWSRSGETARCSERVSVSCFGCDTRPVNTSRTVMSGFVFPVIDELYICTMNTTLSFVDNNYTNILNRQERTRTFSSSRLDHMH